MVKLVKKPIDRFHPGVLTLQCTVGADDIHALEHAHGPCERTESACSRMLQRLGRVGSRGSEQEPEQHTGEGSFISMPTVFLSGSYFSMLAF